VEGKSQICRNGEVKGANEEDNSEVLSFSTQLYNK
jgi:hypothetical protein